MIEKYSFDGEDFQVAMQFEGWKIGLLRPSPRFSELREMERHTLTDEAFILLDGAATLYAGDEVCKMEKCVIYNVPKNVWHQILLEKDTTVMVVENSNTSKENSEKATLEQLGKE